jgi:MFS family permease
MVSPVGPGGFAPLAERPFRLLWLGRVASWIGDALVPIALAFAVLSIEHSGTALGVVLAAFTLSRVAFTLAGGVVADRLSRRSIMLGCDLIRAVVEAVTAALLLTQQMTLPLFVVTAALFGMASAFFGPASDGLVPQTTSPGNLRAANALLGISRNVLNVGGAAVAGILVATAGPGYVFAIDSVSFLVSAFFLIQLRVDAPIRTFHASFLAEARAGFREVLARDWVRAPIAGFAISNFALASFLVLGPLVFLDHFAHGKTDWGIVSACGSAGAIVGGVASVRLAPRRPLHAGFLASVLLAIPIAVLARPLPWPVVAAAWGAGMGSIALSNTWWETTLQQRIPEHVYSRVRSYDILVSFIFMPIGMIVVGPIADAVGNEWTLVVAAAIVATTNATVALAPGVRQLESPDPGPALVPG